MQNTPTRKRIVSTHRTRTRLASGQLNAVSGSMATRVYVQYVRPYCTYSTSVRTVRTCCTYVLYVRTTRVQEGFVDSQCVPKFVDWYHMAYSSSLLTDKDGPRGHRKLNALVRLSLALRLLCFSFVVSVDTWNFLIENSPRGFGPSTTSSVGAFIPLASSSSSTTHSFAQPSSCRLHRQHTMKKHD